MPTRRAPAAALLACLRRHRRLVGDSPILIAASGGVDSTALVAAGALLRVRGSLPRDVVLACIDHAQHDQGARAIHAVARLAGHCGFAFEGRRLDLAPGSAEGEMRRARYAALASIARLHGARAILTAHHADDQIETLVLRMRRGSGVRGLGGIPELRHLEDGLVLLRPLLDLSRRVLARAVAADPWRGMLVVDPSNRDLRFSRNRVRAIELPRLRARHGARVEERILRTARHQRGRAEVLTGLARDWLAQHAEWASRVRARLELGLPTSPRLRAEILRLVHCEVAGAAPSREWLWRAVRLPDAAPGTLLCADRDLAMERTRSTLVALATAASQPPPGTLAVTPDGEPLHFGATGFVLRAWTGCAVDARASLGGDRTRCVFDPDRAPGPWSVRAIDRADHVEMVGMQAPVRLLDQLKRRGVGRLDRPRTPVIVDGRGRCLWSPQIDLAGFARVTPESVRAVFVDAVVVSGSTAPAWSY